VVYAATVPCGSSECLAYVGISHEHKSIVIAARGMSAPNAVQLTGSDELLRGMRLLCIDEVCGSIALNFIQAVRNLYECIKPTIKQLIKVTFSLENVAFHIVGQSNIQCSRDGALNWWRNS
jgi:hypothetical protein